MARCWPSDAGWRSSGSRYRRTRGAIWPCDDMDARCRCQTKRSHDDSRVNTHPTLATLPKSLNTLISFEEMNIRLGHLSRET
jgi:hypothetical protein